MSQVLDPSIGEQARDALARHAWTEAFELLDRADGQGLLQPDELELLGQAAWWTGRLSAAIDARERAFGGYVKAGVDVLAAITAIRLARDNLLRNAHSVATAWMNRAERLLVGVPESPAHGWLAVTRSFQAGLSGRLEEATRQAEEASAIAARTGDRDLAAQALSSRGINLIYAGRVEEGLALADEATVAAVAGDIDPLTAGSVSCSTISACTALGDWPRALQWTEAQDRWCHREQINGFPGMCRLYRAETKRLRGAWLEAESEALRASDELKGFVPAAIGLALYEIGVIRLRRGDLPAAEEALLRAHSYGRDPEPGLSLLRLEQGRVDEARTSILRALEEPESSTAWGAGPGTDLNRLALLPAQVEIALAAGDVATARQASDELGRLKDRFSTAASRGTWTSAEGQVLIAEGKASEAVVLLRRSIQLWSELEAPWETARARMVLATAYRALGDYDGAAIELQSARGAFESLGADLDRRRADEALAGLGPAAKRTSVGAVTRQVVKTFAFTDIVDSTRFAELLGDEAWSRLIGWHDETLRSLVAEQGGEIIKSTGDGFFLAFDQPRQAIDCAIAIQRRLADQRRTQGFAPSVRIGLHRGEANRAGLDYVGRGVNVAARIGALASAGEILASASTLDPDQLPAGAGTRRMLELKGIAQAVEVVTIAW